MASLSESNNKTVLVTGINGYIASHIGLDLLKAGYILRGTTRSPGGLSALLDGAYKPYVDAKKVEVVQVEDITVEDAFDEAVRGVHAIIHTASPLSFTHATYASTIIPAVSGALSILVSAHKHAGPQLEAFVLTSSFAAANDESKTKYTFTERDWNKLVEVRFQEYKDRGVEAPPRTLYPLSKTLAEKAVWDWREEHKPSFSISAINPTIVIGPPVQPPPTPEQLNATLQPLWALYSGAMTEIPPPFAPVSGWVDVRDVSILHLYPLSHPTLANGHRYLTAAGRANSQSAADFLRREYPERARRIPEGEPGAGYFPGYVFPPEGEGVRMDCARAEEALRRMKGEGEVWRGYEDCLRDTVDVFERVYGEWL